MPLIWYEYAVIAAILAGTLVVFAGMSFTFLRVRVQKWIGGAIGNFMQNLAKAAEDEGTEGSSSTTSGALSLGGLQITPELLQTGMQLLKMARDMGFIKGGSGGGGGW